MPALSFIGNLLTAYGPGCVMLSSIVVKDPQLVVLTLTSAFFFMLSTLVASIFWYVVPPLRYMEYATILYTVAIQEVFRFLLFVLYIFSYKGLVATSTIRTPYHFKFLLFRHSFAMGIGMGMMSGLIFYINQLVSSLGPGILQCRSCQQVDVYFISAIVTSIFIALHTVWNIVAFYGWASMSCHIHRTILGSPYADPNALRVFPLVLLPHGTRPVIPAKAESLDQAKGKGKGKSKEEVNSISDARSTSTMEQEPFPRRNRGKQQKLQQQNEPRSEYTPSAMSASVASENLCSICDHPLIVKHSKRFKSDSNNTEEDTKITDSFSERVSKTLKSLLHRGGDESNRQVDNESINAEHIELQSIDDSEISSLSSSRKSQRIRSRSRGPKEENEPAGVRGTSAATVASRDGASISSCSCCEFNHERMLEDTDSKSTGSKEMKTKIPKLIFTYGALLNTVMVVLTHYAASFSTLFVPSSIAGGCIITIFILLFLFISNTLMVVKIVSSIK